MQNAKPGPTASTAATITPAEGQLRSERDQTDESLRLEREKVDDALKEEVAAVDETADAVISRARTRADDVLAATRARTDGQPAASAPAQSPRIVKRERALEDKVLREERATADETLREERAEHVALLSREREETDSDLFNERARSDDALETRDEFLGIVSHDLRNLLNTVMGSAAVIAKEISGENRAEQILMHAQRIHRSGGRMNRLIGDLVDVASIEAGILAAVREVGDPSLVVTEAVESFQPQAAASAVTLTAELVPPSPLAALDPARILQVLSNLISNALKFTPAHGSVVVHVQQVGDEIMFAVSDTGVGIPADQLEAVFERFVQVAKNDRRGVGLGLYISKAIVQGHGGRIWAENKLNGGSTFCFTLPIHSSDTQPLKKVE
jgi:signal transduction histidine kinase